MMASALGALWRIQVLGAACSLLAMSCGGGAVRGPLSQPRTRAPAPEAPRVQEDVEQGKPVAEAERAASNRKRHGKHHKPKRDAVPLPQLSDHESALKRQLFANWGSQRDRDEQATFPLVDSGNWRRVRFRGVPHFTGFTYGQDHDLVSSAFVVKTNGKPTSRRCMGLFESEAISEYESLGGRRSAISERRTRWQGRELVIHSGDGELAVFFSNYRFSVAWAAYPAYQDGCIVYATVVLWGDHPGLAQEVRDRWAKEGFQRYVALTPVVPTRSAR